MFLRLAGASSRGETEAISSTVTNELDCDASDSDNSVVHRRSRRYLRANASTTRLVRNATYFQNFSDKTMHQEVQD